MLKKLSVSLVVWLFVTGMVSMTHANPMSGITSWASGKTAKDTSAIEHKYHHYTIGFQFLANEDIEVTALGYYDHGENGFEDKISVDGEQKDVEDGGKVDVYLWKEDQTPLGSVTVSSSDQLLDSFRYKDLHNSIWLHKGTTYRIGASVSYTTWLKEVEGIITNSAITYLFGASSMKSIGVSSMYKNYFPETLNINKDNDYISANFLYKTISTSELDFSAKTNSVPEPATLLLLGSGLVGLVGFRRRLKK